ncbi:alanine racemase [Rhizobiales bacterium]|uniref:alanine racemase n=1 Tax=Hongsoonwoonella zoysiae TaxID=2821844 RepID=UPI0015609A05|nr:alanine racemase [Hongsoonwoonella zoysiae]NRG18878.1 alanine racemase [Hongsoonwoonella zoysiae]
MPLPADLETPCLILHRDRLERNIKAMADRFREIGVPLRPHLKTAKSIDVARICAEHGADRWTVSTLREAEYFAAHGLTDILYAVSIIPSKLDRVSALNRKGVDVAVCLDTLETARALASATIDGPPLRVFLEIDVDRHRTGLRPDEARLIEIAQTVHDADRLQLFGVMAHGGESYSANSLAKIEAMAEQERSTTVAAADAIREAGIPRPIVSVGSTPTAQLGRSFDGVSEVRAGVYMFQDVFQANLGVTTLDDMAVSVLASVISHAPHLNRLILDAGGLALSKDRSCATQENDCGYGFLADEDGKVIPNLTMEGVSQEHGYVTTRDGQEIDFTRFPIGSRLQVLANHACMTAAAHDTYHVVDGQGVNLGEWRRINGWNTYNK